MISNKNRPVCRCSFGPADILVECSGGDTGYIYGLSPLINNCAGTLLHRLESAHGFNQGFLYILYLGATWKSKGDAFALLRKTVASPKS